MRAGGELVGVPTSFGFGLGAQLCKLLFDALLDL